MVDCLLLLLETDILTGLACPFTNVAGGYFYALMLIAFEVILAIKYENLIVPASIGVILSTLMITLLPVYVPWITMLILVVNFAVVLYLMYVRED